MGSAPKKVAESKEAAAPLPALLSSAIIAVALTLAGVGISEFLTGGEHGALVALFSVLLLVNLGVAVFWTDIVHKHIEHPVLAALPGVSLGLICTAIHDVTLGRVSASAVYLFAGIGVGLGFWFFETRYSKKLNWVSAAFTASGVMAMTLFAWDGIDAWAIELRAKAPGGPQVYQQANSAESSGSRPSAGADWNYQSDFGPEMWGHLSPEYKLCGSGLSQSPVNIPKGAGVWKGDMNINHAVESAQIKANFKFIEMGFSGGTSVLVNAETYALRHAQIHSPSEHTIRGLSYPLEMQFYFRSTGGKTEAVSILAELGSKNHEIDKILEALSRRGAEGEPNTLPLNVSGLLPDVMAGYRYKGSLTSPPCSEGVYWTVATNTIVMSRDQAEALRKINPMSARPVRMMGGRVFEMPRAAVAH